MTAIAEPETATQTDTAARARCPHMVELFGLRFYCDKGEHDDDQHAAHNLACGWSIRADYPGRGRDSYAFVDVTWPASWPA